MIGWTSLSHCVFVEFLRLGLLKTALKFRVLRKRSEQEDCGRNSAGRTLNAFYIALPSVYFTRQEQVDEEISLSRSIVRSFY